jgi:hypothetical protein
VTEGESCKKVTSVKERKRESERESERLNEVLGSDKESIPIQQCELGDC